MQLQLLGVDIPVPHGIEKHKVEVVDVREAVPVEQF